MLLTETTSHLCFIDSTLRAERHCSSRRGIPSGRRRIIPVEGAAGRPVGATEVALPEDIPGQDGMVWTADGRLAIVSNSGNRVVALTSADGWTTAHVAGVAPYETQATTAAVVGDDIYVVHPHFADEDPPSVTRVTFQ